MKSALPIILLSIIGASASTLTSRGMGSDEWDVITKCHNKTPKSQRKEIRAQCGVSDDKDLKSPTGQYDRVKMDCVLEETMHAQKDKCVRALLDFFGYDAYNDDDA